MKLIQLNMWEGKLIRNLKTFIADQQPDIICLQELDNTDEMPWRLEDIKKASGLEHHYFSPLMSYSQYGLKMDFGNCIISRYPFTRQEQFFVFGDYNPDWNIKTDDYNIRNVQSVTVEMPGGHFNIVNYHGYHISSHKDGNELTKNIMDKICDHIETLDGPTVFTGDLNLAPNSDSLKRINTQMHNLVVDYNIKTTRNFTAKRAVEICDYIYISPDIKIKNFYVPDDVVSDHQPLILEL